ncbi:uncharacterized protein LOC142777466 [Rhipicephalus microplus]|uniref:uncharacterized protein LOC142777466 n=1 Tax=Rhipicephalus microplus TaxID=6941 RepID=UPI003F6CFE73
MPHSIDGNESMNGYDGVLIQVPAQKMPKPSTSERLVIERNESFLCVRRSSNLKRSSQERYLYSRKREKHTLTTTAHSRDWNLQYRRRSLLVSVRRRGAIVSSLRKLHKFPSTRCDELCDIILDFVLLFSHFYIFACSCFQKNCAFTLMHSPSFFFAF